MYFFLSDFMFYHYCDFCRSLLYHGKFFKKWEKNKNNFRTLYPKNHENFKNSKQSQILLVLIKKECIPWNWHETLLRRKMSFDLLANASEHIRPVSLHSLQLLMEQRIHQLTAVMAVKFWCIWILLSGKAMLFFSLNCVLVAKSHLFVEIDFS